jgi:hypothetical protein
MYRPEWDEKFVAGAFPRVLELIGSCELESDLGREKDCQLELVALLEREFGAGSVTPEMALFTPSQVVSWYTHTKLDTQSRHRVDLDVCRVAVELKSVRQLDDVQVLLGQCLRNTLAYGPYVIGVLLGRPYTDTDLKPYTRLFDQLGVPLVLKGPEPVHPPPRELERGVWYTPNPDHKVRRARSNPSAQDSGGAVTKR